MKAGTWGAILLIVFFGALAPATVGQIVPTISLLAGQLGISHAAAGLLVSLPTAVPAILGLLGGYLVDRWRERAALLCSAVMLLVGNLLAIWSDSLLTLITARLIEGFSYLGLTVGGASLMIRTTSGIRQTRAMTLWGMVVPIGLGGSIFLVSLVRQATWTVGFIGVAVAAAIAIITVPLLPAPLATAPAPGRTTGIMGVIRSSQVFRLGAGFGVNALLQTGIVTAIPQYFATTFHVSYGFGGLVTSGQMVTNACAAGSVGFFLSRGITVRSLAVAGTVVAIAASVLVFSPQVSLLIAVGAALIVTIGTGLVTGIASALIPAAAPSPQTIGATSGLVFQLVLIGVLAGPPIVFGVLGANEFPILAAILGAAAAGSLALLPIWNSRHKTLSLAPATTPH